MKKINIKIIVLVKIFCIKGLSIDYIDTQKSAIFNWFGWVENDKYGKKIYIGGLF